MKAKFLIIICIIALLATNIHAQDGKTNNELWKVRGDLKQTVSLYNSEKPESSDSTKFTKLIDAFSKIRPQELAFYNSQFKNYSKLLEQSNKLLRSKDDQISMEEKLKLVDDNFNFISKDISAKSSSAAAPDLSFALSTVTVKAIDSDGNLISGCDVVAEPEIITDNSLIVKFNPTNNAKSQMKAGSYVFKVSKSGKTSITNRIIGPGQNYDVILIVR